MNNENGANIYNAQLWRCLSPIIITGLAIYLDIHLGKGGGGSLTNYYYFAIVIGLVGLVSAYLILKSNIVIGNGKLSHRNILGFKTKAIDLQSLNKAYVYVGWWPRWGNVLYLQDDQDHKLRLFLGDRIFGVFAGPIIPNFHHTKSLLNEVNSYATKNGISLKS